ncbi:GGDEF domain-containing protein [Colwellia sp. MEBiC06753]
MSEKSVPHSQFNQLKIKLDTAINSHNELEEDFKKRSSLLNEFIAKLSLLCKGVDLVLDNRLAKLRNMLKKPFTVTALETELESITKLLQQQANKNDANIRQMHNEFHHAGELLQKSKGMPAQSRRQLRELLTNNSDTKDSLIQYIPKLNELLAIYAEVLATKDNIKATLPFSREDAKPIALQYTGSTQSINQFIEILDNLVLSDLQQKKLIQVKASLASSTDINDAVLENMVKAFQIVAADMEQERATAKTFLSTLSGALTKLQRAVKSTLIYSDEQKHLHEKINQKLSTELEAMTTVLSDANSLSEVKSSLSKRIETIAKTVEIKSLNELEYFNSLETQLDQMKAKVLDLEKQGQTFEKRLLEQQKKSKQDGLTKLNNRAAFDEYIAKQLVRFHHSPFKLAIAIIDLDDFKRINDTYGHTAGDKTLKVIASTIDKQLGELAFTARYGGEEFVLVFEELSYGDLMLTLNNLRKHIAKLPFKFKNTKVNISTSIGVTYIKPEDNIHQAFERADQALYQSKNNGKNQVTYAE